MELLHLQDLGDTTSVVTNAVVLVLGECQISIPTSPPGDIYPPVKLHCNILGIYL